MLYHWVQPLHEPFVQSRSYHVYDGVSKLLGLAVNWYVPFTVTEPGPEMYTLGGGRWMFTDTLYAAVAVPLEVTVTRTCWIGGVVQSKYMDMVCPEPRDVQVLPLKDS